MTCLGAALRGDHSNARQGNQLHHYAGTQAPHSPSMKQVSGGLTVCCDCLVHAKKTTPKGRFLSDRSKTRQKLLVRRTAVTHCHTLVADVVGNVAIDIKLWLVESQVVIVWLGQASVVGVGGLQNSKTS